MLSNQISLSYEELIHWAKWADTVEDTIEKANTAVALGDSLLTQSNLEPFTRVLTNREDTALFRSYLKGLHD